MNPKNLEEAIQFLISDCPPEQLHELEKWRDMEESDAICGIHLTGGMNLRNHLNLWGENDLTKWFKSIGIVHGDDISGIIFTSTHRRLNKKNIELDKQIKIYQDHWKRQGYVNGIPTKG